MRELSPDLTRNAARLLLVAIFGFSLWSISRVFFRADEGGEVIPPYAQRASLPFLRTAILVVPEDATDTWPQDTSLQTIANARCNAVLLRMPLLLPVQGRGRLEYGNWLIGALPGIITRCKARGLHVTLEPLFVDAHGLAIEPVASKGQRERFSSGMNELLRALADALAEGNGDALTVPASVLVGMDAEEQVMTVTGWREACTGLLSIRATSPRDLPDTVWTLVDFITATVPPASSAATGQTDSTAWTPWSDLALRVHKPVVASMTSARGGKGLWWDTTVDHLLGWDASYMVAQAEPPSAAAAQWLASQPWLRGMAVDPAVAARPECTALFRAVAAREFEKEISGSETILRGAE